MITFHKPRILVVLFTMFVGVLCSAQMPSSWQIFANQEVQGPIPGQGQLGVVVEVEDGEQVPPVDEGR